ncbi:plexin-C1-like isoform X3 [Salarias fasciatus]|uniref:plexin-C1-like isoform X3 n=1 Tax=Salarias fasciatus TaxID=181472 RepID=UPI001176CDAE|nr:plexin-C1-like isoform X3 [Salarias fasciatus]
MVLLLGLLLILCGAPSLCLEEDTSFLLDGDIRHLAVDSNTVYIATEEKLYQLNHDLTPVHSLTLRGVLNPDTEDFSRVPAAADWNATFRVNVLLPFEKNQSVISCGVIDGACGYCEILDLNNISNILHKENFQVGPAKCSSASVAFLVTLKKSQPRSDSYILTAIQQDGSGEEKCPSDSGTVNLHNTEDTSTGGIFSLNEASGVPTIESKGNLEFVDGFQINSIIYLLANEPSGSENSEVHLFWLDDILKKKEILESLRLATLILPDGGSRLLASSVVPGGLRTLWSGVFSVDGGQTNTQLLLFDISPGFLRIISRQHRFSSSRSINDFPWWLRQQVQPTVLLRQSNMTSVLAVRQNSWMVFFIGTGDGQLIKLAVDRDYHPTCPTVLYMSNQDRRVFPRMHLDPVDHKHVYVPFQNEVKRVAVAKCSTHTNVQEWWTAQDPYCVWCVSKESCTFEDDCEDSDWLSIPDVFQQKLISHKVVEDGTGQLTLNIQTHVSVSKETRFACQFSTTSGELCSRDGLPPQFPQCTCFLSKQTVPPEGLLVTVKMALGSTSLTEQLQLMNCSDMSGPPTRVLCQQCIKAGCKWSNNGCSWANERLPDDSVCQTLQSELNFPKPEISSISPSIVSFYGRNHAVLSGGNLSGVTGVRMQADLDCTPQESPVWNNSGSSLTFHIPRANRKGTVKACVLLPDGSCHGDASITYQSSPSCRDISPKNSWISGGRKITLTGSHLEFVEGVIHSRAPQEVQPPTDRNHQNLTFKSPAATNPSTVSSSSLLLTVANETLICSTNLIYHPDPEFTSFTSTQRGDHVQITIQRKADKLEITPAELSVWGEQEEKRYPCIMEDKDPGEEFNFYSCEIQSPPSAQFQTLMIKYGDKTVSLAPPMLMPPVIVILCFMLIPYVIAEFY